MPPTCSESADGAPLVVGRRQRKHHVVGGERMAVGEDDVRPQLDRVAQAIVGPRPAFREPGLDVLRRGVHANEPGLREERDEYVVASCRVYKVKDCGSVRTDATSAPRAAARSRRVGSWWLSTGGIPSGNEPEDGRRRKRHHRESGQELSGGPTSWPP